MCISLSMSLALIFMFGPNLISPTQLISKPKSNQKPLFKIYLDSMGLHAMAQTQYPFNQPSHVFPLIPSLQSLHLKQREFFLSFLSPPFSSFPSPSTHLFQFTERAFHVSALGYILFPIFQHLYKLPFIPISTSHISLMESLHLSNVLDD